MGQAELNIFIASVTFLIAIFIVGIFLFIAQYRKRKILHEVEKKFLYETHQKELLQAQLEIQQQTMQHIGREIHDNVGQKLTLASLYAQQIDYENKFPELTHKIASVGAIINESLNDLRELSKNLTTNETNIQNLVEAIEQECKNIQQLNYCTVHFTTNKNTIHLSSSNSIVIVRIVQEFLQNSLKHSKCKNIFVQIAQNETGIDITLEDDGIGFLINQTNTKGIGLKNIQKRAELIHATCTIESSIQQGTTLQLTLNT